jgi:hypothetical protein
VGLFSDIHDPLVRDVVNTALTGDLDDGLVDESGRFVGSSVAEPVGTLHGDHCFAAVETVKWSHRRGREVTGTTFVLVCGWPEEHNPFLDPNLD